MTKRPFFSIVIPTYNRAKTLQFTLFCLLKQNFHDFEVIISDNCSVDNTRETIMNFHDKRITYHRMKRTTPYAQNLKNAMKYAKGKYIFLHSDDDFLLYESSLQKIYTKLNKYNPGYLRVNYICMFTKTNELFHFRFHNPFIRDTYIPPSRDNKQILDFILNSDHFFITGNIFRNTFPTNINLINSEHGPWIDLLFYAIKQYGGVFMNDIHLVANWSHWRNTKGGKHPVYDLKKGKLEFENYFAIVEKKVDKKVFQEFLHNQLMGSYVRVFPLIKVLVGNNKLIQFARRMYQLDKEIRYNCVYWIYLLGSLFLPSIAILYIRNIYLNSYINHSKISNKEKVRKTILALQHDYRALYAKNDNLFFDSQSSVFIATFSHYEKGKRQPRNGMVDPLLSFFLPKVETLVLLDQPHVISDIIDPIVEVYKKNKIINKFIFSYLWYFPIYLFCKIPTSSKTRISYKLRDFISVLIVGLTQYKTYDYFIGLEAINTLSGIILKKFGRIKTVIYYVSDYSPTRFGDTWFNKLYIWLDRFCIKYADATWDVSPAMKDARKEVGISQNDMKNIITVPNGLFPAQIESLPITKRRKNSLVYLGSLTSEFGVDLAIEALSIEIKKIPDLSLHIIGGGAGLTRLQLLVKKLHLENHVIFYGFVQDNKKMAEIVKNCSIGLAPYLRGDSKVRWYGWYGDAGKIRQYLASGLPVITTHIPPLGRLVVSQGAAILTNDTVKDFAKGIETLIRNKQLYKKLTERAKVLSKENTWENSYKNAFIMMSKINN